MSPSATPATQNQHQFKGGNPTGQFLPDAPSRSENTMEAAGKIEGMVEEQWCAKCAQIK
jgi:23S rRNA C2498 (ribose-2'-O)-methylase RlmM